MNEQQLKDAYLTEQPSEELKERVIRTCRAAKKKSTAARKRAVSAAACFVVILTLGAYGLSPVPGLSTGDALVSEAGTVPAMENVVSPGMQRQAYGISPAAENGGECVALTLDKAAQVSVSAGELLYFDMAEQDLKTGDSLRLNANEAFYWALDGVEEGELKARSGLRTTKVHLEMQDGKMILVKES